jgi:transcriptional regulator with XRE-family HTH domain
LVARLQPDAAHNTLAEARTPAYLAQRMHASFADVLNDLLRGAGLSANKLAERVEVDAAQVGRWRKGRGVPRPENIVRIATVFDVDYEWLMGLAYPASRLRAAGPQDPRLAAFLSEIGSGWLQLDEHERPIAERGARALFRVAPTRARRQSDDPLAHRYSAPSAAFNAVPAAAA